MKNLVFAIGPHGSYIYNAPEQWAISGLPQKVKNVWPTVLDIICASFGPEDDSYFVSYMNKAHEYCICYGDGIPSLLKTWLIDSVTGKIKCDRRAKVSLGPNDSFFAWDSKSIRWSHLPALLEEDIQSWLSPSGWVKGPPRIVALGASGTFCAISEHGAISVSDHHEDLADKIMMWMEDGGFRGSNIAHVSLCPVDSTRFFILRDDNAYSCVLDPEYMTDGFFNVVDSLCEDETITIRRAHREKIKMQAERKAREHEKVVKEEEERIQRKLQREKEEKDEAMAAELPMLYTAWKTDFEERFTSKTLLTVFPTPPRRACYCEEMACSIRKSEENSLTACRHDMERLLRASGNYSLVWLKKQSLTWHPDRFGQHCEADFRIELCKKATMMYAIFGELMETLKEPPLADTPPTSPRPRSRAPSPAPSTQQHAQSESRTKPPPPRHRAPSPAPSFQKPRHSDSPTRPSPPRSRASSPGPHPQKPTRSQSRRRPSPRRSRASSPGPHPQKLGRSASHRGPPAARTRAPSWAPPFQQTTHSDSQKSSPPTKTSHSPELLRRSGTAIKANSERHELNFPIGATITDLEFHHDTWLSGKYNGHRGKFQRTCIVLNSGTYFKTGVAVKAHLSWSVDELRFPGRAIITDIKSINSAWWYGTFDGRSGMFPRDCVLVSETDAKQFCTGTAVKAQETWHDEELRFPIGAIIKDVEFHNGTWWRGTYEGKTGLFPREYVLLNNLDGTRSELL